MTNLVRCSDVFAGGGAVQKPAMNICPNPISKWSAVEIFFVPEVQFGRYGRSISSSGIPLCTR